MSPHLGAELPRRPLLVRGCLVAAVFFAWPTFLALRAAATADEGGTAAGAWALGLAMLLLVVVLPLVAARFFSRWHIFVSGDAVSAVLGDRVRTRLDFADVERVTIGQSAGLGLGHNTSVTMVGHDPSGRPVTVVVTRTLVATLEPLLTRLDQEARSRPGILTDDQRAGFEAALAES